MKFPVIALVALLFTTGCSPLTYRTREVPLQQVPTHPLPAGATYVVVVPETSIGWAKLAEGIRIHGMSKAISPATAEVTIEATVSSAMITDQRLEVGPATVAATGAATTFTPHRYCGTISVPSFLSIRTQRWGTLLTRDRPAVTTFAFALDPETHQQFGSPSALDWSFAQHRDSLRHQASYAEVQHVLDRANAFLADAFTTRTVNVRLSLAVAHQTDARFAAADIAFSQALVGDAAGLGDRLKPVIESWRQIVDHPLGDSPQDRAHAQGAATYNQAVALFLSGLLDDAERATISAAGLEVDASKTFALTTLIQDRRRRQATQPEP
jgi:hypothetical protein